jgi:membrane-associated phospholipid phosphatase
LVAALVAFGFAWDRRSQALAAAGLVVIAISTAEALKPLLAHTRTFGILGHDQVGAAAFPSGHATAATAVALAAMLVAPRRFRSLVAIAAIPYAVAVCTSILVLGWHFPSDVFGGMLVAAFWFCVAVAALRRADSVEPRPARPAPFHRWRELALAVAAAGLVLAAARAGDLAAFASEHTTATAIGIAVAVGSTAIVGAASLIADR